MIGQTKAYLFILHAEYWVLSTNDIFEQAKFLLTIYFSVKYLTALIPR